MKTMILFDTALGTSNLGDEVIYRSFIRECSPFLDKYFQIRYATHVQNFTYMRYLRSRYKRQIIEKSDCKIIVGTNLLTYDVFKSRLQWPIDLRYIGLYKNVIMAGVGTTQEPRKVSSYSKLIYKSILNPNAIHSVRDEVSADLLRDLGFNVINTGCPTLWCLTPEHCALIPQEKAPNAVFSISGYRSLVNKDKDQIMLDIIQKNYDNLYFWCQTASDENYLKRLNLEKPYTPIYSLNHYEKVLKNEDVDYVGSRLHGGVFALQNKVRAIVIGVDQRARGFHKDFNLNVLERDKIDELDSMIHSRLITDIHLKEENIELWKSQFEKI